MCANRSRGLSEDADNEPLNDSLSASLSASPTMHTRKRRYPGVAFVSTQDTPAVKEEAFDASLYVSILSVMEKKSLNDYVYSYSDVTEIDDRLAPGIGKFIEGLWQVPKGCER